MRASIPSLGTGTVVLGQFLRDLGAEVVMPPVPTRRTLELGVRHSPEQICLPFKVTLGNLIEAVELGADTLFMAAGTRKCRFGYYHLVQERILRDLYPGCRLHGLSQYSAIEFVFRRLPEIFGINRRQAFRAVAMLLARSGLLHDLDNLTRVLRSLDFERAGRFHQFGVRLLAGTADMAGVRRARQELQERFAADRDLSRVPDPGRPVARRPLRVGLVGEVYLMLEPLANSDIEKELGRLGVEVRVERSLYRHLRHLLHSDLSYIPVARYARRYIGESPGGEVIKTLGEAVQFCRRGVDGIIHIFPFTCMPENMALEILQHISHDNDVPLMSLSFDEHTGKAGLITRLEAFVEMLRRRRVRAESGHPELQSASCRLQSAGSR